MNHQQVGDAAKLGNVLLQLSEIENPPARFAAGSDAAGVVLRKAESIRKEAEEYKELSFSTDGLAKTELLSGSPLG